MSAIHLFDLNGSERFNGTSPGVVRVLGPFDVAWDDAGIGSNPGALITAIPAGSLFVCTRCIVTEQFAVDASPQLSINAQFGDLHDYWETDRWDVGQFAIVDGLAGATAGQNPTSGPNGAFFVAAGNLRAKVTSGSGTQGHADIYALIATL